MSFHDDMSDIIADPHKWGAPTFQEWLKFRERFKEQRYVAVDAGGVINQVVEKYKYFFRDSNGHKFKCKSLDAVWKVAQSEGVAPMDVDYDPQIVPQGNGKCNVHVTFYRKPVIPGLVIAR